MKARRAGNSKDNPDAHCLPMGLVQFHNHGMPWTVRVNQRILLDNELTEFICHENQKFESYLKGQK